MNTLSFYLQCFDKLRCDKSYGSEAPHKAVLLLAIIRLFRQGIFHSAQITITPALEDEFANIWQEYVQTNHQMNLGLPFYHLRDEPFGWQLTVAPEYVDLLNEKNRMKNINTLKDAQAVATIDAELLGYLLDKRSNQIIDDLIVWWYFQAT